MSARAGVLTPPAPTPPAPDRRSATVRAVAADRRAGRRRSTLVAAVLAVAVVVATAASLAVGEVAVALPDLLRVLTGTAPARVAFVVGELRAPRTLVGLLVGAAFGVGGAITQRLMHNPLASPDVIGISAGASAAAVLAVVVLGLSGAPVSLFALAGALATAALVLALSRGPGGRGQRFVLIGVGVGALAVSLVSWLLTSTEIRTAEAALLWLTGSLNGVGWGTVVPLALALAVLGPLAAVAARALPGLALGDDTATGLGLPVGLARTALLGLAVALVGVATAAAGPVTFVAFVSGPIAARLVGHGRAAVGHAALVGALVVVVSDLAAGNLLGVGLPVGVVTGAVGAPYLLWLIARSGRDPA